MGKLRRQWPGCKRFGLIRHICVQPRGTKSTVHCWNQLINQSLTFVSLQHSTIVKALLSVAELFPPDTCQCSSEKGHWQHPGGNQCSFHPQSREQVHIQTWSLGDPSPCSWYGCLCVLESYQHPAAGIPMYVISFWANQKWMLWRERWEDQLVLPLRIERSCSFGAQQSLTSVVAGTPIPTLPLSRKLKILIEIMHIKELQLQESRKAFRLMELSRKRLPIRIDLPAGVISTSVQYTDSDTLKRASNTAVAPFKEFMEMMRLVQELFDDTGFDLKPGVFSFHQARRYGFAVQPAVDTNSSVTFRHLQFFSL